MQHKLKLFVTNNSPRVPRRWDIDHDMSRVCVCVCVCVRACVRAYAPHSMHTCVCERDGT